MNKKYKYRCPWCGEKVLPPSERFFTVKQCSKCEHYYSYYWPVWLIIWEAAAVLCLCASIRITVNSLVNGQMFPILLAVLSLGLFPDFYFKKMLKKAESSNTIDDLKSWRIRFKTDSSSRFMFVNNAIFPIELVSADEKLISEKYYVRISQVCRTQNEINCVISELTFNRIQEQYKYDCFKIYVLVNKYFNGELICENRRT